VLCCAVLRCAVAMSASAAHGCLWLLLVQVWGYMGVTAVLAIICIPALMALHTGSHVALWLLLPLMLGSSGCLGGLMTSIGPCIYPAVSPCTVASTGPVLVILNMLFAQP